MGHADEPSAVGNHSAVETLDAAGAVTGTGAPRERALCPALPATRTHATVDEGTSG